MKTLDDADFLGRQHIVPAVRLRLQTHAEILIGEIVSVDGEIVLREINHNARVAIKKSAYKALHFRVRETYPVVVGNRHTALKVDGLSSQFKSTRNKNE